MPPWTSRSPLPRGVAFLAVTAPTGAADPASAAPLGRGDWAFALGTTRTKSLGDFDVFLVPQGSLGLRSVGRFPGGERETLAAAALGVGWTVPRLTARVDPQLRWPSALAERWVSPRVADLTLQLRNLWRLAVTYEDQTVVPLHRNVSLGRGVAVAWVHRGLR